MCVLVLSILCGGLWMIRLNSQCEVFQEYSSICIEIALMIFLVSLIKLTNSIFFSALIPYSSEIYPTVVRSLGYGFTLTFGRMSTFIVPFYINYMRAHYENRNSLCFLSPFGLLGFFLCFFMQSTEGTMRDNIPQEEEEMRLNRDFREI